MPARTYSVESLSTGDVAPRERAEFWREHIGTYQSRMDYRYARTDNFRGGTVRQHTEAYQLVRYWSDEIAYARTARQVKQDPDENYRFLFPVSGEIVLSQDDQEGRLTPGAGGLVSFGAPFECLQRPATEAFILTIPAHEVNGRLNRTAPLAAALDLDRGLGRVVRAMLGELYEQRDSLTDPEFNAVSDRIIELLCMLAVGDDRPDVPGHLGQVEAMVRRYVREHAADPELNGAATAHALGWSLRQVQLALQRVGTTPRELIREERLRLVRDRLQRAAYDHLTVTDLAYASGFSSASALSTAFRRRFGMSPRELRHSRR